MRWLRRISSSGSEQGDPTPAAITAPPATPPRPSAPSGDDAHPYASTVCPSCETPLDPLPKAKKKCPSCGQPIYVRSGPDGRRHLLAESQLAGHEEWWARHQAELAQQEWTPRPEYDAAARAEDAARGLLVGDYAPEVVGTHRYQDALAPLVEQAGPNGELIAELVREPGNQHDPNAIRVVAGGQTVGYLDRSEAADYQPLLRHLEGLRRRALCRALLTREGKYGEFSIEIEGIPEPPDSV